MKKTLRLRGGGGETSPVPGVFRFSVRFIGVAIDEARRHILRQTVLARSTRRDNFNAPRLWLKCFFNTLLAREHCVAARVTDWYERFQQSHLAAPGCPACALGWTPRHETLHSRPPNYKFYQYLLSGGCVRRSRIPAKHIFAIEQGARTGLKSTKEGCCSEKVCLLLLLTFVCVFRIGGLLLIFLLSWYSSLAISFSLCMQ